MDRLDPGIRLDVEHTEGAFELPIAPWEAVRLGSAGDRRCPGHLGGLIGLVKGAERAEQDRAAVVSRPGGDPGEVAMLIAAALVIRLRVCSQAPSVRLNAKAYQMSAT